MYWPGKTSLRMSAVNSLRGDDVLANAAADTYGNYLQLTSASAHQADGLLIMFPRSAGSGIGKRWAVDIASGGAGSEQVLIPKIRIGGIGATVRTGNWAFFFPLSIPQATRLAARAMDSVGNNTLKIKAFLLAYGLEGSQPLARSEAYGPSGASGTVVDPGATIDTKGAWTELAATTGFDVKRLYLFIAHGDLTQLINVAWAIDIGIGGAGSEQVLVPNLLVQMENDNSDGNTRCFELPVSIPSGTRVAVRARCNTTNSDSRKLEAAGIGMG